MEKWDAQGLLIKPNKKIWWMSTHVGSTCAEVLSNNLIRLYISGRAKDNKSRIGSALIKYEKKLKVIEISKDPILDIPEKKIGTFFSDGILYPEIIKFKKKTFLYFCGWLNHKTFSYNCNIGVSIKKDNKFSLDRDYPLFNLNKVDPIGTGSMTIHKVNNSKLRMYYVSFDYWKKDKKKYIHKYYLKIAESTDGINWIRKNKIVIKPKKNEIAIAHPTILIENNKVNLYYCSRKKNSNYNIYKTTSKDGIEFIRNNNKIKLRKEIWDNKAQCYPEIFEINNQKIMLYCGNQYGKTGLGYSIKV
jgi:predicted GH43/DUF377 family glycosyl hydrolase